MLESRNVSLFRLKVYRRRIHRFRLQIAQNTKHPDIAIGEKVQKFGLIKAINNTIIQL